MTHDIITNAEAGKIRAASENLKSMASDDEIIYEWAVYALRLLADRAVAMEIIEILLKNHTASDFHYQQPYCVHCHSSWDDEFIKDDRTEENHNKDCIVPKARALIAAVRND